MENAKTLVDAVVQKAMELMQSRKETWPGTKVMLGNKERIRTVATQVVASAEPQRKPNPGDEERMEKVHITALAERVHSAFIKEEEEDRERRASERIKR